MAEKRLQSVCYDGIEVATYFQRFHVQKKEGDHGKSSKAFWSRNSSHVDCFSARPLRDGGNLRRTLSHNFIQRVGVCVFFYFHCRNYRLTTRSVFRVYCLV